MPIYEYVCAQCQHQFEVKQKLADTPLSECMRCGGAVTKLISAPAIMFKGTGWYVTDYSDKLKPPSQGDGAEQPKDQKEKTDQKPAAAGAAAGDGSATAETGSTGQSSSSAGTAGSGSTDGSGSPSTPPSPSSTPSSST